MLPNSIKNELLEIAGSIYLDKIPTYKVCKKNHKPFFMERTHIRTSKKFVATLVTAINTSEHKDTIKSKLASVVPDTAGVSGNGLGTWSQSLDDKSITTKLMRCVEDFVCHTVHSAIYEDKDFRTEFYEKWENFQTELTSPTLKVKFFMPVSRYYWSHNGAPEKIFEGSNVKYSGFPTDTFYYSLMAKVNSAYGSTAIWDEIDKSRILLVAEYELTPPFNLGAFCSQAYFEARKAIFPVQLTSDSSIHIDCAVPHLLGNYCTDTYALLKSYYDHEAKYEYRRDVDQYEQEQLRQASYITNHISNDKVVFVDTKVRQYASRLKKENTGGWSEYKSDFSVISPYVEKVVDLVQILEGNIGECGKWNAKYLVKILGIRTQKGRTKLTRLFTTMYDIRNKYLHADIYGKDGLYNILTANYRDRYGFNHDRFVNDIELFSYHVKKACYISILQPDIRDKVVSYHISLGRNFHGDRSGLPTNRLRFPRIRRGFKVDW